MVQFHSALALAGIVQVPEDDGAARHLTGAAWSDLALPSTDGDSVNLARKPGRTVVYIYARTDEPGKPSPAGWDAIPGARGCTPQSCGFRDRFADLGSLRVARVYGISTQDTGYQREAVQRLGLPFPLLSDAALRLARGLGLPTFEAAGMVLLKRMALVVEVGIITKVFYPVTEPERNAEEVVEWLRARHNERPGGGRVYRPRYPAALGPSK